ncbi:glutathione S-transferase T2 isoform X1 [Oryza sativa Japonica Group]|uniref:Os11g0282700 protein n=3 Tax=Oryza sativa subsp. japonica TaxID=39947 RepID=Q0ITA8_ORYSJ|nr:glutathione S-transferase T3 isoform X2 [Oryza sativa Japonica Group]ABG22448.1 transposon protein, putative, Pong sub-class, expressed [Oryza sativa Japonica Group]KAF2910494.1 hypothetical protein DAI22_11g104100 [Oryza sativa Japonica Group]BAF28057.1 Os11g0282700 [Oryza sativa Japonica Group]BAG96185.1 unnamed protein product [Oryza sativa Japonica Group]BAT13603.1 Os11g0282700 [Oryza sativa Japonica Group]|eukprot:NP_001067694.1 Os11g0282700 [Oryza sativa Japonica Group]
MGRSKREVAPPPQALPASFPSGMWLATPPMQASFAPGGWQGTAAAPGGWQGMAPPQPPQAPLFAYGANTSAPHLAQMKQGSDRSSMDDSLSDLQESGMDSRPPGGFLSYFQDPSSLQNHQPSIPLNYYATQQAAPWAPSPAEYRSPVTKSGPGEQHPINIDSGGEETPTVRTEKRLTWTHEEDIRLVSAWLNNLNDSINGNFKKNDCYWGDVTTAYNSTTPRNRMRQEKQIKDRFHKIKKNVGRFCCAYKEVKSIYVSGQNELQLMEKVHATYEADYKEGQFTFLHCWKALRDQPKWHAYLEELEKPNKTKSDNEVEVRELTSTPNSPEDIIRPEGTKAAKARRNGKDKRKRKAKVYLSDMDDEIDKPKEVQNMADKGRDELLETQRRVSSENLESKRLAHLAAMEHKEAVMLETYRALMLQDTKDMPDDVRFEHVMALKSMREKLFPKTKVSKMLILAACFGSASAREATYYIIFSNPPILSKQNLCSNYLLSMSLYGSLLWPMNDVWIIVID